MYWSYSNMTIEQGLLHLSPPLFHLPAHSGSFENQLQSIGDVTDQQNWRHSLGTQLYGDATEMESRHQYHSDFQ